MFNDDINNIINKYLNIKYILLLRQTYKKNNFRIIKEFNYVRKINTIDNININKNDVYNIELILYNDIYNTNNTYYQKLYNNINLLNNYILDKINIISIINKENIINYNYSYCYVNVLIGTLFKNNKLKNLKNIKCNFYTFLYLADYFYFEKLYIILDKLYIDIYKIKNKQINLYSMFIKDIFLNKINCKNIIFINSNNYFKEKILEEFDNNISKLNFNIIFI